MQGRGETKPVCLECVCQVIHSFNSLLVCIHTNIRGPLDRTELFNFGCTLKLTWGVSKTPVPWPYPQGS